MRRDRCSHFSGQRIEETAVLLLARKHLHDHAWRELLRLVSLRESRSSPFNVLYSIKASQHGVNRWPRKIIPIPTILRRGQIADINPWSNSLRGMVIRDNGHLARSICSSSPLHLSPDMSGVSQSFPHVLTGGKDRRSNLEKNGSVSGALWQSSWIFHICSEP